MSVPTIGSGGIDPPAEVLVLDSVRSRRMTHYLIT